MKECSLFWIDLSLFSSIAFAEEKKTKRLLLMLLLAAVEEG